MINELLNFYRIGKSLGLKPREINKVLSYQPRELKSNIFFWSIILVIVVFITIFIYVIVPFFNPVSYPPEDTYPSNALYSTIKLRNFKKKR